MSLYRRSIRAAALVFVLALAAIAGAADPPGPQPKDDKKSGDNPGWTGPDKQAQEEMRANMAALQKRLQAERAQKGKTAAPRDPQAEKLARLVAHPFWAGQQTKEGVEKVLDRLLQVDFDKDAEYALVQDDGTVKPFPKPAGRIWPVHTADVPHVPGPVLVRVAAGKRLSREQLMDELNKSIQTADMFWPKKKK